MCRSFEVSDQPVRAGKFVPRKQWIVAGSDDMQIRVFNYNTMEKVRPLSGAAPTAALSSRLSASPLARTSMTLLHPAPSGQGVRGALRLHPVHRCTRLAAAAAFLFGRHDHPAVGLGQAVDEHDDVRGPLALCYDGGLQPKGAPPLSSPATLALAAALASLPCRAPRIIAPHWQDTNTFASASLDRTIKVPRRLPSPCSLSLSNSLALDL